MPLPLLDQVIQMVEDQAVLAYRHFDVKPAKLVISEDLLGLMARDQEIWLRQNFLTQITSTAPVLNKFYCSALRITFEIVPSRTELLFHLE